MALGPGAKRAPMSTEDVTKDELLERAAELEIEGRSSMNKAELADAIAQAEGGDGDSGDGDGDTGVTAPVTNGGTSGVETSLPPPTGAPLRPREGDL